MRVVYFGSGAFGLPTLERLCRDHEVVAVVTQPDRPAGRGAKLTPTPVGEWAARRLGEGAVLKPARVNTPEMIELIRGFAAEAWVVIAFGQKLPKVLLEGRFAVNLHASLLPRWRGAAPINAALLAGDAVTGNTVITLADRMDAGLILGTSTRAVDPLVTAGELHDLLAADGPELVERVLAGHAAGTLKGEVQDEGLVTIATKLSKGDGTPDFNQPADFVRRQIQALTPWPGVTAELESGGAAGGAGGAGGAGVQMIKLLRARVETGVVGVEGLRAGTVVDAMNGLVVCGRGTVLRVLEVQPAGKRGMDWASFARGRSIAPMSVLGPVTEMGSGGGVR